MATPYPQSKFRAGVPLVGHKSPSDAQKEAGNYPKGHTNMHGMRVSIENEAGTFRRGKDPSGKDWKQKLRHDYGYIRGTRGFDKDHLDVFLGPDHADASLPVWVIDQDKKDGSDFDEHKVMMGFKDADDAIMAYHSNYEPGWSGFRAATPMSMADFKEWAYAGKSGKRKPASEYVAFKKESIRGEPDTDTFTGGGTEGNSADGSGQRLRSGNTQAAQRPRSLGERLATKRAGRADPVGDEAARGSLQEGRAGEVQPPEAGADPAGFHAGRAATGYREGGAVDREPGESQRGDDREGRPFVGYRSPKRREANNDRKASASVPASVLRGRAAGVLGLPGDVEGILRTVGNAVRGNKVAETLGGVFPGLKLATDAFGSSEDTTPRLPTSEFYNEWLPGRAEGAANRAGEFAGNLTAPVSPLADAKAGLRGLAKASPIITEALRSQAPKIEAALMKAAPAAAPMYAIKPKGGNWFDPYGHIATESHDLAGEITPAMPAFLSDLIVDSPHFEELGETGQKWLSKRLKNYLQNDMGTATDPLLQLEAEGKLWFDPNVGIGYEPDIDARLEQIDPGAKIHQKLTGRADRTPLEQMTDALVETRQGPPGSMQKEMADIMDNEFPTMGESDFQRNVLPDQSIPEWVTRVEELGDPFYALHANREGYEPYERIVNSFDIEHLGDYLSQALKAGASPRADWVGAPGVYDELGQRMLRLHDAGLAIDPTKLDRMSLADVGGKAADWGRKMEEWAAEANRLKDWNKGVKEVLKQYPEGGQWVELNPEALGDEGEAMGHCVGGYCSSVESGDKRILSYRDQEGPHITVELARPQTKFSRYDLQDVLTPEQWKAYNDQIRTNLNLSDEMHAKALFGDQLSSMIPEKPWEIRQIKGKGNRAPVDKYQPFAKDLVRNMGPWGDNIRDLRNTGLVDLAPTQIYSHERGAPLLGNISGYHDLESLSRALREDLGYGGDAEAYARNLLDMPHIKYAKGGSVEGPAFRSPMILKRREDRQDREGAKEVPPQLLRGAIAGTLGFGGDIEQLVRMIIPGADKYSKLPTSDFYKEVLPFAPTSASGRAAGEIGSAAGTPLSLPATKAARALIRASEMAAEPLIAGRRGTRAAQSGAIKLPGGNWIDRRADKVNEVNEKLKAAGAKLDDSDMALARTPKGAGDYASASLNIEDKEAAKWFQRSLSKWMQNDMGTARDPLLKLEAEGRLHLTPEQLQEDLYDTWMRRGLHDADPTGSRHFELTGRNERTPWEARTDAEIKRQDKFEALREDMTVEGWPEWQKKFYEQPGAESYRFRGANASVGNMDRLAESLGLRHLADYLNEAVLAGSGPRADWAADVANGFGDTFQRNMLRMHDAGLAISPKDLQRMGWADFVAKAGDWNKAMEKWRMEDTVAKDWNKGVKSVLKEYPEHGGQWVELSPEALADEGTAMGHCVGGYCRSVEGGHTRVLSYRDKEGPHITVELSKQDPYVRYWDALQNARQGDARRALIQAADEANETLMEYLRRTKPEIAADAPWEIRQIKGKGNMAPADKYKPMAQDLVRNLGPWGSNVYDLKNTGLVHMQGGMTNIYDGPEKFSNITMPEGYFTPAEVAEYFMKQGVPERSARQHAGDIEGLTKLLTEGYPRPEGFAQGGTVTGRETVGQGMIGGTQDNQGSTRRGWGLAAQPQVQGGRQVPNTDSVALNFMTGSMGGNPNLLSQVPRWNVNDPGAADAIKAYTKTAGAGIDMSGAAAFLRANGGIAWNPGIGGDTDDRGSINQGAMRDQENLARMFGIDLGQDVWAPGSGGDAANMMRRSSVLDEALKDYRLITGIPSTGPLAGTRTSYETLYRQSPNGDLVPIWARERYVPEKHGWARSESGGSFLQAASMMLPAVGGYAGLAGQAAGTTGATAANLAGNAAMGYIRGGTQGMLGSLAGGLGGLGGGYFGQQLGGATGQALGSQIGSQAGNYLVNRRKTGGSVPPLEACFDKS